MKQGWDRSRRHLTVGLLVSGTSAGAAKLLGLIPPGVSNQQGPVKLHKDVLDLLLGLRMPDGIHLAGVSAALDADPDVNIGEPVLAQEKDGLLELEAQGLRLDELQGTTIHLDQSLSALAVSHSSG